MEYKNLIKKVKNWRFYNELRIRIFDKRKEILALQKEFTYDQINIINFQIKSYILEQEKCLLIDLLDKEFSRLNKVKEVRNETNKRKE